MIAQLVLVNSTTVIYTVAVTIYPVIAAVLRTTQLVSRYLRLLAVYHARKCVVSAVVRVSALRACTAFLYNIQVAQSGGGEWVFRAFGMPTRLQTTMIRCCWIGVHAFWGVENKIQYRT